MIRSERWVVTLAAGACLAGAFLALSISTASAHNKKPTTPVKRVVMATINPEEARVTSDVVSAANRLTKSIALASTETSSVLSSSFSSLARSQAALSAERAQLASEAQQLANRAAALTSEEKMLQKEAATLRAAQSRSSRASTTTTTTVPSGLPTHGDGGGGGNDH